jgi:glycine cleavage system H protein
MEIQKRDTNDLYYTQNHEWIDFQGSVAYIGISRFKLIPQKSILQVVCIETADLIKKGEPIASIQYADYQILVHMPVDAKIISLNDLLSTANKDEWLHQNEMNSWIALVVPDQLHDKAGLLSVEEYDHYLAAHRFDKYQ